MEIKIILAIIWHKIIMICHFNVPYQLNYGLIYKMSKNYKYVSWFLIFLSGNYETGQLHHDTDSQNVEWGLHTDINSIFPDFLLTFWWVSKFHDPYENLLTFPDFLSFSLFPDFFLTCGNPANSMLCKGTWDNNVKSDVKRRNTLGCLNQYMAPNSKYAGDEWPHHTHTNAGECPHSLKCVIKLWWTGQSLL